MNLEILDKLEHLEIKFTNGFFFGINKGNHFQNLIVRLNHLSVHLLNEPPEENLEKLWKRWGKLNFKSTGIMNCLCGHFIKKIFYIRRQNIRVLIGSECIKRFGPEAQTALNDIKRRNCLICGERIKGVKPTHIYNKKICETCRIKDYNIKLYEYLGNVTGVYF